MVPSWRSRQEEGNQAARRRPRVATTAGGVGSAYDGYFEFYRSAPRTLRLSGSTRDRGPFAWEGRVLRYILIIVYLAVGVFIANSHHYFSHLNSLTSVLSALLAVVLWPLILVGVNLHIK